MTGGGQGGGNIHLCRMTSEALLRSTDLTPEQSIIRKRAEKCGSRERRRRFYLLRYYKAASWIESSATKKGFGEREKKKNTSLRAMKPPFSEAWHLENAQMAGEVAS